MRAKRPAWAGLRPGPAGRTAVAAWIVLLGVAPASAVADENWTLRRQQDGVVVHTRSNPGWSVDEFRGVTSVRAPLRGVVAVLLDADRHSEWMHDCREARALEQRGIEEGRVYTVTDAPWPVNDRDSVMHWRLTQDEPTGIVTIALKADAGALPARAGHVRVPRAQGRYELVPRADGTVEVTYQLQSDPGGLLPGWLARSWAVSLPFHTLRNLPGQLARAGSAGQSPEYESIRQPAP